MDDRIVFISSWHTVPGTGGIYTYRISEDGEPQERGFVPLLRAGYLAFSPDKKYIYSTCGVSDTEDGVAAFSIADDGSLTQNGEICGSGGLSCCHLTVSPDGKWLYAANYLSGSFSEFAIAADGSVAERTKLVKHSGSGPVSSRQESPHPHCCVFSSDDKFMCVADLGCDRIYAYPFDAAKGISADPVITAVTAGQGPRHLLFDSGSNAVYLVNELGSTLYSFAYSDGGFQKIDELPLLPRGVDYHSKAAAVRMSPDGQFIAASNRGLDSLAIVEIDAEGKLFPFSLTMAGGISPRDINFLPGNGFAAANEFSDEVVFFDFENGRLTPNGYKLSMPRPLCILPLD